MKSILALIAACGATTALAAPRESVDLATVAGGPIMSFARINDAGNATITHTFAGSDGGGAYTARYLTVSGSYNRTNAGSWYSEASVLCTPPGGGTPFIIQPFTTTTSSVVGGAIDNVGAIPTGSYAIPVSAFTTAGAWSFQFFDRYDDGVGAEDGNWSSYIVTLDDGTPPAAAPIGPVGHTYTNATISGATAAPGFDQTFTAVTGTSVAGVRIRVQATGTGCDPAVNSTVSPTSTIAVRVTPPGGAALPAGIPFAANSGSTSIGEILIPLTTLTDSAGSWRVEAFNNNGDADYSSVAHTLAVELVALTIPSNTNLGTAAHGVTLSGTATLAAGQTKWYKFNLPTAIQSGQNRALEIDTEGSTTTDGTGALNTSIGLFGASGARVLTDFADGSGSLGTLTLGVDNRPAPGDGLAYNGRDGGNLAAGDYYVAVTAGDTGVAYQPGLFGVANTSTQTGDITLNVRYFNPSVTPATPPTSTDLGTYGANPDGSEHVYTTTATIAAGGEIRWYKFTTAGDALANGFYMDIDTDIASAVNDTEIGVYAGFGGLLASDDDDGDGLKSALSFGNTTTPRAPIGVGVAGNGRDGILPAGSYYLATAAYNVTYNTTDFNVTTTGTATGDIILNFRTNIPANCSVADVGTTGGVAGQDRRLDNNDFVAFINLFFASAPAADVGRVGGQDGADNAWDNNDFVVFINHFFNDAANCTG